MTYTVESLLQAIREADNLQVLKALIEPTTDEKHADAKRMDRMERIFNRNYPQYKMFTDDWPKADAQEFERLHIEHQFYQAQYGLKN